MRGILWPSPPIKHTRLNFPSLHIGPECIHNYVDVYLQPAHYLELAMSSLVNVFVTSRMFWGEPAGVYQ